MKKELIQNATHFPQVYYGLHMVEGVAEYTDAATKENYRILILENTIKAMDPTFAGKPVYVQHVETVDLANLQAEADGYVSESFFNKSDGKHWAKFIAVSDRAHEAIKMGWRLSNAYHPTQAGSGGKWHNVEYAKEVTAGQYEHLAIVQHPRYEESVILTPEEFKAYNSEKENQLHKLANSKEPVPMLNFFKKNKIENAQAVDLEGVCVRIKSGREMTITQLVNEVEEGEEKKKNDDAAAGQEQMANGEHKVKVGDDEMTVNELIEKHTALKASMESAAADKEKANSEVPAPGVAELTKKNEETEEEKNKKAEDKKQNSLFAKELKEAADVKVENSTLELSEDKVSRGKSRYGSN